MKTINLFAATAMLVLAVACNTKKPAGNAAGADSTGVAPVAENVISAKGLLPSKAEIDTVSYLMGINFGSMIKGYNLGELNFNELKKGINDFVNTWNLAERSSAWDQTPTRPNRWVPSSTISPNS